MKVIVAGSRKIQNELIVNEILNNSPYEITELVSGHAIGIDQIGEMWAKNNGIAVKPFLPKYKNENPKYAPLLRNIEMSYYADALIAIWDGQSKGTRHMISEMTTRCKPYHIYMITDLAHPIISLGTGKEKEQT